MSPAGTNVAISVFSKPLPTLRRPALSRSVEHAGSLNQKGSLSARGPSRRETMMTTHVVEGWTGSVAAALSATHKKVPTEQQMPIRDPDAFQEARSSPPSPPRSTCCRTRTERERRADLTAHVSSRCLMATRAPTRSGSSRAGGRSRSASARAPSSRRPSRATAGRCRRPTTTGARTRSRASSRARPARAARASRRVRGMPRRWSRWRRAGGRRREADTCSTSRRVSTARRATRAPRGRSRTLRCEPRTRTTSKGSNGSSATSLSAARRSWSARWARTPTTSRRWGCWPSSSSSCAPTTTAPRGCLRRRSLSTRATPWCPPHTRTSTPLHPSSPFHPRAPGTLC